MNEQQRRQLKRQRIRKVKRTRRIICLFSLIVVLAAVVWLLFSCSKRKTEEKEVNQIHTEQKHAEKEQDVVTDTDPEEEPAPEIDIVMVGDVLLHTDVQESGKLSDGTYNYDHLFAHVSKDVQAADIAIVNQEVMLGGKEIGLSGYPSFNGPYEIGDALVKAGFNVILHATNHTLDRGKKAILNCLNFWESKYPDIAVIGSYASQEAYDEIYVYEQDGIKIAILNYTYGTNGISVPNDMPYAVRLLEEKRVIADIQEAKELADFVIVCPHWGTEYQHTQSSNQKYWANLFLENGVDLVIGAHPHVIQPIEMLTDTNGNEMLVYYSLGNFVNATSGTGRGTADRMIGGMAEITLSVDDEGAVYIKEYGVEPLVTQLLYGTQQITTYKLSDYTEELATQNKTIEKDSAFSLQYCKDLCEKVFGDLYDGSQP